MEWVECRISHTPLGKECKFHKDGNCIKERGLWNLVQCSHAVVRWVDETSK